MSLIEEELPCEKGLGGWKTQKSLSHITPAWLLPPTPAAISCRSDLVLETGHVGPEVIKLTCLYASDFLAVFLLQMPNSVSAD